MPNNSFKNKPIAVVGLGYVGLPLAILAAKSGFKIFGIDKDQAKIDLLLKKENYLQDESLNANLAKVIQSQNLIPTTDFSSLKKCQAIFICLPTPIKRNFKPDIRVLINATKKISQNLNKGTLIINESTVAIGTTRKTLGLEIIEKNSHLKMGRDFYLVCSPERVDPGTKNKTENIAKLIGGIDQKSSQLASKIYREFINAPLMIVDSPEIAEGSKMLENSYRALNIALVNEFAKLCEKVNLDAVKVINAAATKWTFQAHWPSLGTGGHCIPVDPYYLTDLAAEYGVKMPALSAGLKTNHGMPQYFFNKIIQNYHKGDKVIVYGLSYKKNIADLRESPSLAICALLKKYRIPFEVYDPFYSSKEIKSLGFLPTIKPLKNNPYHLVVIATDHDELKKDILKITNQNTIILDGKNFLPKKIGRKVIGIGRNLE